VKWSAIMATPEETFHQLLGLGESWRVIRTEYETETNTFVIGVEETPKLWEEESAKCGQRVTCYDHVEPMGWRHLNVFQQGVRDCDGAAARPAPGRRDDLPGEPAVGGTGQALHQRV